VQLSVMPCPALGHCWWAEMVRFYQKFVASQCRSLRLQRMLLKQQVERVLCWGCPLARQVQQGHSHEPVKDGRASETQNKAHPLMVFQMWEQPQL